jgi:hypothetical protein
MQAFLSHFLAAPSFGEFFVPPFGAADHRLGLLGQTFGVQWYTRAQ